MKRSMIFVFLLMPLFACSQPEQADPNTVPNETVNLTATSEEESPVPSVYTVKAGDTLVGIASAFGVTKDELMAANPGFDGLSLVIGQELIIPEREISQLVVDNSPASPPDCAKIAFGLAHIGNSDIYTVCLDGSNLTNLTNGVSSNFQPAWSPEGDRIAFVSNRDGTNQIYIMDENGLDPKQITWDNVNDYPIWLPGGEKIAFRTTDGEGLWWWQIVDLASSEISQFSEPSFDFFFQTPAWSPDGQYIAYMSLTEQEARNDGSSQIHVMKVDQSSDIALTNDTWANIKPVWSPHGTKIAFLSERDGIYNMFALYIIGADRNGLQKLTEPIFSELTTFTWSPDEQFIAITRENPAGNIIILNVNTGETRELLNLSESDAATMPSW